MKVFWLVEKRIILLDLETHLDIEAIVKFNDEIELMLKETSTPIHIIALGHELQSYPMNIAQLMRPLRASSHSQIGWIIATTSSNTLRFIIRVVSRILGSKIRFVDDYLSAATILRKLDPDLPELPETVA